MEHDCPRCKGTGRVKKRIKKRKVLVVPSTRKHTPLSFSSPESTTIARASYRQDLEILTVEFKSRPGYKYLYKKVSIEVYRAFRDAPSRGGFFQKNIKTQYDWDMVAPGESQPPHRATKPVVDGE